MRMASSERSARFPRILLAAPHRLAFLVGTLNVIALALWWLAQMAGLHLIPLYLLCCSLLEVFWLILVCGLASTPSSCPASLSLEREGR